MNLWGSCLSCGCPVDDESYCPACVSEADNEEEEGMDENCRKI